MHMPILIQTVIYIDILIYTYAPDMIVIHIKINFIVFIVIP